MRVFVAEDDRTVRLLLERILATWGYEVVSTCDGDAAWEILLKPDAPKLVILDRIMPGVDGLELCRRIRAKDTHNLTYIIHLTTMDEKENIIEGLEAGANDYMTKPFSNAELRARVEVGERMVRLQSELADRVEELENAQAYINQLHGVLPICAYCHKIRDDHDDWQRIEAFISEHSEATFSHSYCPDCLEKHYPQDVLEPRT
ncbi:MAG: response regulator transcription factor [Deltaproteobacteria bacterium]|nr:response regulator transcription factor [Deltaproteobacteria bacterium]